jgi:acetyl-CoA synthetase (ADP-forming)
MIKEVKAYKMLKGYRNMPPRDIKSLIDIIMKAQKILIENPEISEMDLNPVMSYPDRALIVDARFILNRIDKKHPN